VNGSSEIGVQLQVRLGGMKIVVGLCLLEGSLTVLSDHDECGEKDRLQRNEKGQKLEGVAIEPEKSGRDPHHEDCEMDPDKGHRAGKTL